MTATITITATEMINSRDLANYPVGGTMELFSGVTGKVTAIARIIRHGKVTRRTSTEAPAYDMRKGFTRTRTMVEVVYQYDRPRREGE
jgi:hypothetical protein